MPQPAQDLVLQPADDQLVPFAFQPEGMPRSQLQIPICSCGIRSPDCPSNLTHQKRRSEARALLDAASSASDSNCSTPVAKRARGGKPKRFHQDVPRELPPRNPLIPQARERVNLFNAQHSIDSFATTCSAADRSVLRMYSILGCEVLQGGTAQPAQEAGTSSAQLEAPMAMP